MWGDKVTVVSSDMRAWTAPEKADIIVSELLGSFGDNELSPECLDGGQMHLKGLYYMIVLYLFFFHILLMFIFQCIQKKVEEGQNVQHGL